MIRPPPASAGLIPIAALAGRAMLAGPGPGTGRASDWPRRPADPARRGGRVRHRVIAPGAPAARANEAPAPARAPARAASDAGFTLIEALIAMAVLAVAAAGLVRATGGHVDAVAVMTARAAGGIAAGNALAEARLGLTPAAASVLGREWHPAVTVHASDDPAIAALTVTATGGADQHVTLRGFRDTIRVAGDPRRPAGGAGDPAGRGPAPAAGDGAPPGASDRTLPVTDPAPAGDRTVPAARDAAAAGEQAAPAADDPALAANTAITAVTDAAPAAPGRSAGAGVEVAAAGARSTAPAAGPAAGVRLAAATGRPATGETAPAGRDRAAAAEGGGR